VIPFFEIRILEDVTVETNLVLMKLKKPRTNNNHSMQNNEIEIDKKWFGIMAKKINCSLKWPILQIQFFLVIFFKYCIDTLNNVS
jgi:hypothetical protein